MNPSLPDSEALLILPLRVQNANAISSPLTHGFPSMTAFLGLMWALERKLNASGIDDIALDRVGVVCHHHEELTHEGFVKTFRLTRNPVDKAGKTAAIVEEGRMHMDITLLIGVSAADGDHKLANAGIDELKSIANRAADWVATMRVAGGNVIPQRPRPGRLARPELLILSEAESEKETQFRSLRRRLLPGFALVCRDDLLQERLSILQKANPEATALDAWLDLARFNWRPKPAEGDGTPAKEEKVDWYHDRPPGSGWIVPIPVGYGALSELHDGGTVKNARDETTPFRFVESLYSVGQWISPHHLTNVNQLLWYADSQPDKGLYRCRNTFPAFNEPVATNETY